MLMEIQEQKIVSGCKNPFRTFYIAVMHYGVWLLIFAKGRDANRQSMKCHQLPALHGQYRKIRRRVG